MQARLKSPKLGGDWGGLWWLITSTDSCQRDCGLSLTSTNSADLPADDRGVKCAVKELRLNLAPWWDCADRLEQWDVTWRETTPVRVRVRKRHYQILLHAKSLIEHGPRFYLHFQICPALYHSFKTSPAKTEFLESGAKYQKKYKINEKAFLEPRLRGVSLAQFFGTFNTSYSDPVVHSQHINSWFFGFTQRSA